MNASNQNGRVRTLNLFLVGAFTVLVALALWALLSIGGRGDTESDVERVDGRDDLRRTESSLDPVDGRVVVRGGTGSGTANKPSSQSVDPAQSIEIVLHFDEVLPTDAVPRLVVDGMPYIPSTHKFQYRRTRHRADAVTMLREGRGDRLARIECDVDREFSVPMPEVASLLLLQVDSDFVRGIKTVEFDPASPIEVIHMQCEVGGFVQLRAVGDRPLTEDEREKVRGLEILLASSTLKDRAQVWAAFEGPGICTMRAVPPGRYTPVSEFSTRARVVDCKSRPYVPQSSPFRLIPGLTFAVAPGERLVIEVPVRRGRQLFGRVTDSAPVRRARVEVRMREGDDEWIEARTRTGDDGTFEFEGLADEITRFEVSAGGAELIVQARRGESLDFPEDEPLVVNLGESATIEYVVTAPDGSPVAGASVDLDVDESARVDVPLVAPTDADGRAQVSDLPFVPHVATVMGSLGPSGSVFRNSHQGHGRSVEESGDPEWYAAVNVVPSLGVERQTVALELKRLPEVTLRLSGNAIEETDLVILRIDPASKLQSSEFGPGDTARKKTCGTMRRDPSGTSFCGRLAPGSYRASVYLQRTFSEIELVLESHTTRVVIPDSGEPITIPLRVPPTRAVIGTLNDESGRPLSGVKLYLQSLSYTPGCYRNAVTNDRGEFRFDMVVPGSYEVITSSSTYASTSKQVVDIPAGTDDWALDLEATQRGAIDLVIDFRGTPPDVDVNLTARHQVTDVRFSREIRLDQPIVSARIEGVAQGQNTLGLSWTWKLDADFPGKKREEIGAFWSTTVDVVPGETVQAQLIVDPAQLQLVRGRVKSSAPIDWDGTVEVFDGQRLCGLTEVDEIGRFEFWVPTLEGLSLDLTTSEGQRLLRAPLGELIGPDGRVEVEIAPGCIRGRLTPLALEAAGIEVKFAASCRGSQYVSAYEFWEDEWFDLVGLEPGTYDVYVKRFGSDECDLRFESKSVVVTDSSVPVEVTLDLK